MTFLHLVLIGGATARLVRLVQADTILDRPRARLQRTLEGRKISELLWCPWCLSIWVGGLVAASWVAWGETTWWAAATAALCASLVTGLVDVWQER